MFFNVLQPAFLFIICFFSSWFYSKFCTNCCKSSTFLLTIDGRREWCVTKLSLMSFWTCLKSRLESNWRHKTCTLSQPEAAADPSEPPSEVEADWSSLWDRSDKQGLVNGPSCKLVARRSSPASGNGGIDTKCYRRWHQIERILDTKACWDRNQTHDAFGALKSCEVFESVKWWLPHMFFVTCTSNAFHTMTVWRPWVFGAFPAECSA